MIFTDRKITIRNGKSSINEPVILYRGDYEVSIKFTIMESKFRFKSGVNLVDSEKASHGQLAILAPYGGNVFSEIVKCEDGTVTFTLTKEMIDQLEEVGLYSFQIRLFDYYRESRVSIPPVEFGIEVREPVASEDHDNEVNNAIVGYSIAKVVDPKEENVGPTFDANGQYNKTDWETGDRITEGKLNKIEDALDKMNKNEKNDVADLDKRVTNNFNVLDANKADKNEIFSMKNMGQDVKEAMTGGSVAVVGKNAILTENIVDGQVTPDKTSFFVRGEGNILNYTSTLPNSFVSSGDGTIREHERYASTDYFRVKSGDVIRVSCIGPVSLGAYYDENGKFIQGVTGSQIDIPTSGTITVPNNPNIKYCRMSMRVDLVSLENYYIISSGGKSILTPDIMVGDNSIEARHIAFIDTSKLNILQDMTINTKCYVDTSTGGLVSHELYGATSYFRVNPGQSITIPIYSPLALGAYYDADYNYIAGIRGAITNELSEVMLEVPDLNTIKYCRLSMRLDLLPLSDYYVVTNKPVMTNVEVEEGSIDSRHISHGSITKKHLLKGDIINDIIPSTDSTYSSSALDQRLVGYRDTSTIEWTTDNIATNTFENQLNVLWTECNGGNIRFEHGNVSTWGLMYTTDETFEFETANLESWFYLVYNVTGESVKFILINGQPGGRGHGYELTDYRQPTVIKSPSPIVEVGDLWASSPNRSTVFVIRKEGNTIRISVSESVGTTEVCVLTEDVNCVGILTGASPARYTSFKVSRYTNPITVPGVEAKVKTMENDIRILKAGGSSGDLSSSRFAGTKILVAGDSITEANFRCNTNWHGFLKDWLQLGSVYNEAKSGTGLVRGYNSASSLITRLPNWPRDNYSMILLMGNMNDYSGVCPITYNIGTFEDQSEDMKFVSLYGALHYTCKYIIENYPNTSFGWIISTPRQYDSSSEGSAEKLWGRDGIFEEATVAIKEVCGHYGIPVLDLYHESGLRPWLPANNKMYFSCSSAPNGDGVHPNDAGQELMARRIYEFVKQYM